MTYATQFKRIAKALIANGKISQYGACAEFYGGLPERTQEDLQRRLNIYWTNVAQLNVETIIQDVITMETEREERKNLMHSTTTALLPEAPPKNPPSSNNPSVARAPHEFTSAPAPRQNQPIDDLASMLSKITLSMAEMANAIKTQQSPQQYRPQQYPPRQYQPRQFQQQNSGNAAQFSGPSDPQNQFQHNRFPPSACTMCGEEGHWRSSCQVLDDMIQKGIVHQKGDRKIYLGRTGDTLVNRLGFRTIAEAAMAAHNSRAPYNNNQNGPAPAPVTSIVAYRPNPYMAEVAEPAPINSIYATVGALGYTDVDAAEKRKAVQPAAPQKRQAMEGAFQPRVTRSQTVPPPTTLQPPAAVPPPITITPPTPAPHRYPFSTVHPPTTFPPVDLTTDISMEDGETQTNTHAPRERRTKTWGSWQLSARDKMRTKGPQELSMMEVRSLMNPTVWNWLWDDRDRENAVISYVGEDEEVTTTRHDGAEVFAAEDAIDTLGLHKTLPRGFLRGPTPYIVTYVGALNEAHYALVDTGSQVNIMSERLASQLNLPIEHGSPLELHNASGTSINVIGICRDVDISTVARRNLQTFLVTSTHANDLLLGLPWFMSVGARMKVSGSGSTTQLAISVVGEEGQETSVKAIFSDNLVRTPQGLTMTKN